MEDDFSALRTSPIDFKSAKAHPRRSLPDLKVRWPAERLCGFLLTLVRQIARQRSPKSPQTMNAQLASPHFGAQRVACPFPAILLAFRPTVPLGHPQVTQKTKKPRKASAHSARRCHVKVHIPASLPKRSCAAVRRFNPHSAVQSPLRRNAQKVD